MNPEHMEVRYRLRSAIDRWEREYGVQMDRWQRQALENRLARLIRKYSLTINRQAGTVMAVHGEKHHGQAES
jgi:hypothetical protein